MWVGSEHTIHIGDTDQIVATLSKGQQQTFSAERQFILKGMQEGQDQVLYVINGSTWSEQWIIRTATRDVVAKFGKIMNNSFGEISLHIARGMDAVVVIIIAACVCKIIKQEQDY